jgi:DNA end-binding protein Ku
VRSLWKGVLTFGLVVIPVKLYPATESRDVRMRYLHAADHGPIQYRKVCAQCGQTVPPEEVVLGVETQPGVFVTFREEELAELPSGPAHTVEIERFVPDASVDALFFQKAYYLEPEAAGQKAYALLHRAMQEEGRSAMVRITLRRRERWALVRAREGPVLVLETLLDADEVRPASQLRLPEEVEVKPVEERLARDLIQSLATDFRPEEHPDRYREALEEWVRQKAAEHPATLPTAAEGKVVDLMEALRASLSDRQRPPSPEPAPPEEVRTGHAPRRRRSRAHAGPVGGGAL